MIGNKPFEVSLTNFSAVEKTLSKGIAISYATRNPVVHFTFTNNIAAGIFEPLYFIVAQATAAAIR